MTIQNRIRAELVLLKVASWHNQTVEYVRQEMQKAIDAAWSAGEPAAMAELRRRFPAGKPTVEEFTLNLAAGVSN